MWRGKIKRKKFSWKLFSSFFRIFSLRDIVLLANFFSRDVRNAFHVSRVPFRENFLFGEINLLMDKFANCAVGIRILARTSQHGCQIYSILVQRNTLSWIVLHKMFFRKLPDLAEKSSDGVWKTSLVLSNYILALLMINLRNLLEKTRYNYRFQKLSSFFETFAGSFSKGCQNCCFLVVQR